MTLPHSYGKGIYDFPDGYTAVPGGIITAINIITDFIKSPACTIVRSPLFACQTSIKPSSWGTAGQQTFISSHNCSPAKHGQSVSIVSRVLVAAPG